MDWGDVPCGKVESCGEGEWIYEGINKQWGPPVWDLPSQLKNDNAIAVARSSLLAKNRDHVTRCLRLRRSVLDSCVIAPQCPRAQCGSHLTRQYTYCYYLGFSLTKFTSHWWFIWMKWFAYLFLPSSTKWFVLCERRRRRRRCFRLWVTVNL